MQSIFTLLERTPGALELKASSSSTTAAATKISSIPPILLHSFSGSPETVAQITTSRLPPTLASQVYFSISRLVHARYPPEKQKRM
jgi:hypothetical protein